MVHESLFTCAHFTDRQRDRLGCVCAAGAAGPEALLSFLRFLRVQPLRDSDACLYRVWVVDWTFCAQNRCGFLCDLLLPSKDSPCPHVRRPAFPLESVRD